MSVKDVKLPGQPSPRRNDRKIVPHFLMEN